MSETRAIVCPSGLAGEVRGLKTKEANLFTDPNFLRSGTALEQVLANCWLATVEAPLYPFFTESNKVNWGNVLLCDRFYALMHVRVATYGAQYDFTLQCTHQLCRQKFEWSINLLDDLPVKLLPEESKRIFTEGNRFQAVLGDTRVVYKLLTGNDERQVNNRMKQAKQQLGAVSRIASIALASRIVEIEGVHANDKMKWLEDLDMADVSAFIALMDESDGGIETSIEVECPHCGSIVGVEQLPFERQFWMPKKRHLLTSMG